MLLIDNWISIENERLLNCSCSSIWTKNGLDNSEGTKVGANHVKKQEKILLEILAMVKSGLSSFRH